MIPENTILFLLMFLIAGVIIVLGISLLRSHGDSGAQIEERKTRLLLVDSDANARDTLIKFLRFEKSLEIVGVASTGKTAVDKARQTNPTVVLLDVSLPDMDGLTVSETIAREMPGMRFVFTRKASDPVPGNWPSGLSQPLEKPLDYRELIKAISRARRYV